MKGSSFYMMNIPAAMYIETDTLYSMVKQNCIYELKTVKKRVLCGKKRGKAKKLGD